jgi:short-subunit dehydrogenase
VQALPEQVIARHGAVDGVVHCAGIIQPFVKLQDLDYDAINRVFAVNWLGTLYLTKTFLPVLLARPEAHIVNVASMGGFLPVPGQTIYGASKAAVKLLTEGLHSECAGTTVHITAVFPGGVATNITTNSGVAIPVSDAEGAGRTRKITTPERAARDILDGVEKDAYRVLIGRDAKLMDLLYRLAPRRAAGLIASRMKDLLRR